MSSFESRIDRFCALHPQAPREAILASRLLARVARALEERINEALAPFTLDRRQYLALAMLAADEKTPTIPSELGTTLDATRVQITRLLDDLVARGLVARQPSSQDRRSLELTLTAAGRKLLARAAPQVHAAYQACWSALAADEQTDTVAALRKLYEALGGSAA